MKRPVLAILASLALSTGFACSLPQRAALGDDRDAGANQPDAAQAADAGAPMADAQTPDPPAPDQPAPDQPTFDDIDKLIAEQKMQAALDRSMTLVEHLRGGDDAEAWTRALVLATQLQTALSGFETAVTFLRTETWPDDPRSRLVLDLFDAQTLVRYRRAYGWDIEQREAVVSAETLDPAAWTSAQIADQIHAAFARAFARRDQWGDGGLDDLAAYIDQNDYPPRIRGRLRDTVSYLWAEALADTGLWSAKTLNAVERLDFDALLAGQGDLDSGHPLSRLAAVLGDLERWHRENRRPEAGFEATRQRLEHLRQHAGTGARVNTLIARLEADISALGRRFAWWSMGMATLADLERGRNRPDNLVRAHRAAQAAAEAYPGSIGGRRGAAIVTNIETPAFQLGAMAVDGLDRRSVVVEHKNLETLHLRAYRLDLANALETTGGPWRRFDRQRIEALLAGGEPVASWRLTLENPGDFEMHRRHINPPLETHGLYALVASDRADFDLKRGRTQATVMQLSPLVLIEQRQADRQLVVSVLAGDDGTPRTGATVSMLTWRGNRPATQARQATTDDAGRAVLPLPLRDAYALLVEDGEHRLLGRTAYGQGPRQSRNRRQPTTLIYTDRAVYRPGQEVLFKTVTYAPTESVADSGVDADVEGDGQPRRFAVQPNAAIDVALYDANGEVIETISVTTNDFGTANGRFTLPSGRLQGAWRLGATWNGHANIRVEAYKRPTFEVEIDDPENPLRLGKRAVVTAAARYYFGLPVTEGEVRWRVVREPDFLPWRGRGGNIDFGFLSRYWPQPGSPETIAAGEGRLDAEGRVEVRFDAQSGPSDRVADRPLRYRFRLEVDITSAGGETRSAGRSFVLGDRVIDAQFDAGPGFFTADTPIDLVVTRRDLDGQPRAGEGRWRLVSVASPAKTRLGAEVPLPRPPISNDDDAPAPALTDGDLLRPRWQHEGDPWHRVATWPDGDTLARGAADHGENGAAQLEIGRLGAGLYRIVYTTEDRFGGSFETRHDFLVVAPEATAKGMAAQVPLPAWLKLEQENVQVGDRARLAMGSGMAGQRLRLEVLRGQQVVLERTLIGGSAPTVIEVPIGSADRGGLVARLVSLADYQLIQIERRLRVPYTDRDLDIRFTTFRDRLRAGDAVQWRVDIAGEEGALAADAAEILASMYDRSLDIFAQHRPPSLTSVYPQWPRPRSIQSVLGRATLVLHRQPSHDPSGHVRPLTPDRLRFFDNLPIGGPGRFGGPPGRPMLRSMRAGAAVPETASMNAPASPARVGAMADEAVENSAAAKQAGSPPTDGASDSGAAGDPLRSDFAETAFWLPQLLTDADGGVTFSFTAPDSVTAWSFWVEALTRDLRGGSAQREVTTTRELLVRPQLPRFLRTGDQARLVIVVDNTGDETLRGTLDVDILDTASLDSGTETSRGRAFGLEDGGLRDVPFEVPAQSSIQVEMTVTAPRHVEDVAVRALARAGDLADGELRPLPVLPSRMQLSTSRFAAVTRDQERTLRLDGLAEDDPTRINQQLVVSIDGQLLMSVLEAVPSLIDDPNPSTTALVERFAAAGALDQLFEDHPRLAGAAEALAAKRAERGDPRLAPFDEDDPNRRMALTETPWLTASRGGGDSRWGLLRVLDPSIARVVSDRALVELMAAQRADGAFSWFPGGPASTTVTLQVLWGLAKAVELGVDDVPADAVQKAWRSIEQSWLPELRRTSREDCCYQSAAHVAYVLSAYDDAGQMTAGVFTEDDRKLILDRAFAHWKKTSPLVKVYLSLALARAGRLDDSNLVLDSVLDSARTDPDLGTYWQPEPRAWLFYNDDVVGHAMVLRALTELRPDDPRRQGLVQWLMLNKQLNQWRSTRATAEVLYSVVHSLKHDGTLLQDDAARITIGDRVERFVLSPAAALEGDQQLVIPGEDVAPSMASIAVENEGTRTVFARVTWHYSTDQPPARGDGDLFTIARRYFRREPTADGFTLTPLADGATLAVGDQVEVQLEIAAGSPAEFVHARDPRPAGLEPEDQRSGYRFDRGIGWYEQVADSGADLFFERLPAGTMTVRYRLRANVAGRFRAAPAVIQSIYAPSFTGHSAGGALDIHPQP